MLSKFGWIFFNFAFLEGGARVEDACEGRDGWNWDPFEPHDMILTKNQKKNRKTCIRRKRQPYVVISQLKHTCQS